MTIIFTEDELEWIIKEPFNWTIKQGCPDEIRKTLEEKLKQLYNK